MEIILTVTHHSRLKIWWAEAVVQRCSVKKVFFEISQKACNFIKKETLAQVFSCECCEISKDTFSYRTLLVAASDNHRQSVRWCQIWTPTKRQQMVLSHSFWLMISKLNLPQIHLKNVDVRTERNSNESRNTKTTQSTLLMIWNTLYTRPYQQIWHCLN